MIRETSPASEALRWLSVAQKHRGSPLYRNCPKSMNRLLRSVEMLDEVWESKPCIRPEKAGLTPLLKKATLTASSLLLLES